MAGNSRSLTIKLNGDTTGLNKAIKSLNTPINKLQRELSSVNRALKFDPGNTTLMAQKQELLAKKTEDLRKKFKTLEDAKQSVDKQFSDGKISEEDYRKFNRELEITKSKLNAAETAQKQFVLEVDRANSILGRAGDKVGAFGDKAVKGGTVIKGIGDKLMGVSIAAGTLGVAMGKAAIDFESSFAGVRKTVDATEEEFERLRKASLDMSTVKPVDANDVNQIMELGGQLGITTDNLEGFAGVIADLDVATNMDIESASTQMAQYANITGMAQKDFERFGSTIVDLGNNFATTEADIMAMAHRIAGAGSQIGMTDDQILAISTSLASVGINAEAGGTAVSTVMSNIDKSVATNGKTLKAWAEASNMSVEDFKKSWSDNAALTMQKVFEGLGSGGENLNIVLEELGVTSLRQTDMMKRMSNAAGVLGDSFSTAGTAWKDNTALSKEAEQRYATTASQLKMLWNEAKIVAIEFGGSMLPAVKDVIGVIKKGVKSFQGLDDSTKKMVGKVLLFTAAAAPMLKVTGSMITGVGKLAQGFSKFTQTKAVMSLISWTKAAKSATTATNAMSAAQTASAIRTGQGTAAYGASATAATKMGASTSKTATGLGKFGSVAGTAISTVGKFVPVLAGVGIAAYALKRRYDELNHSFFTLEDRSEIAAKAIKESDDAMIESAREKVEAFNEAKANLDVELSKVITGDKIISDKTFNTLKQRISELMGVVKETIETESTSAEESFAKIFSYDGKISEEESSIIAASSQVNEKRIQEAQELEDRYIAIIKKANKEKGGITHAEQKKLNVIQQEALKLQMETLTKGQEAQIALLEELKAEENSITWDNFKEYTDKVSEASTKSIGDLEKAKNEAIERAQQAFADDPEQYQKAVTAINESYAKQNAAIESNSREQLQIIKNALEEEKKIIEEKLNNENEKGTHANRGLVRAFESQIDGIETSLKQVENTIDDSLENQSRIFKEYGSDSGSSYTNLLAAGMVLPGPIGAVAASAGAIAEIAEENGKADGHSLGQDFGQGYADGIMAIALATGNPIGVAAAALAKAAQTGVKSKEGQDSNSPSKKAHKLGLDFTQGYINGIVSMINQTRKASSTLGKAAVSALSSIVNSPFNVDYSSMKGFLTSVIERTDKELEQMRADATKRQRAKEKSDYETKRKDLKKEKKTTKKENAASEKKELKDLKKKNKKNNKSDKDYQKKKAAIQKKYNKKNKKDQKKLNNEIKKLDKDRKEQLAEQRRREEEERIQAEQDFANKMLDLLEDYYNKVKSLADSWKGGELIKEDDGFFMLNDFEDDIRMLGLLRTEIDKLRNKGLPQGMFDELAKLDDKDALRYMEALNYMTEKELANYIKNWELLNSDALKTAEKLYAPELADIGKQMDQGIANGILQNGSSITDAMRQVIGGAINASNAQLDINSPSGVYEDMGEDTIKGYVNGVLKDRKAVKEAIKKQLQVGMFQSDLAQRVVLLEQARQKKQMQQGAAIVNGISQVAQEQGNITIVTQLVADGRQLAEVVSEPLKDIQKRQG